MYTEIQILDLQKGQEKQALTLKNYEKMIEKFHLSIKNLKALEEKKVIELSQFNGFLAKFYPKSCPYRSFADQLMQAIDQERLEVEQLVSSAVPSVPAERDQLRAADQVVQRDKGRFKSPSRSCTRRR